MKLTKRQKNLIIDSLQARICFIETGTNTMRVVDAEAFNRSLHRLEVSRRVPIKALTAEQHERIVEIEALITTIKET